VYTPAMKTLLAALKKTYDEHCSATAKTENQVVIIDFLMHAFAQTGLRREIYLCNGKFDEIKEAWKLGAVHNTKNTGPDMKVTDAKGDDHTVELKTAHTGWDVKANFSFASPEVEHGETKDVYFLRMCATWVRKGSVIRLKHNPEDDVDIYYELDPRFVGAMIRHKNTGKPRHKWNDAVNVGAVPCTLCRQIHRLRYYEQLQLEYAKAPAAFDLNKVDVVIPRSAGCGLYSANGQRKTNK